MAASHEPGIALAGESRRVPGGVSYLLAQMLCVMAAATHVFQLAGPTVEALMLAGASALGIALCPRAPIRALQLLPMLSLLGYAVRIPSGLGMSINIGDIYLFGILLPRVSHLLRDTRRGPIDTIMACLLALAALSTVASADPKGCAITVIGLLQYGLVFLLTRDVVRTREDGRALLFAWGLATLVAGLMVVVAYRTGQTLLLSSDGDVVGYRGWTERQKLMLRPSFFVTGFIFPLGACLPMLLFAILFMAPRARTRFLLVSELIGLTAVAIVVSNRTSLVAALACSALVLLAASALRDGALRRSGSLAVALAVIGAGVYVGWKALTQSTQDLWVDRATNEQSFEIRMGLWKHILSYLATSPSDLVLGLGPDFVVRGNTPILTKLLYSPQGGHEGAVDNTYIYVLMNYGVLSFLLVIVTCVRTGLVMLSQFVRRRDALCGAVLVVLLAWAIMSWSQQCSVSKIAFFLMQAMALADLLARGFLDADDPRSPRGAEA